MILLGILTGVGAFTFGYGKGWSYLSNDPDGVHNCHVMQDHYDSWQKSSHRHVAVCNDCHLPHHPIGKWVTKGDNGFFHSLAFTLENFHEPISDQAAKSARDARRLPPLPQGLRARNVCPRIPKAKCSRAHPLPQRRRTCPSSDKIAGTTAMST